MAKAEGFYTSHLITNNQTYKTELFIVNTISNQIYTHFAHSSSITQEGINFLLSSVQRNVQRIVLSILSTLITASRNTCNLFFKRRKIIHHQNTNQTQINLTLTHKVTNNTALRSEPTRRATYIKRPYFLSLNGLTIFQTSIEPRSLVVINIEKLGSAT